MVVVCFYSNDYFIVYSISVSVFGVAVNISVAIRMIRCVYVCVVREKDIVYILLCDPCVCKDRKSKAIGIACLCVLFAVIF